MMSRELLSRLIFVGLLALVGIFIGTAWVSYGRVTTIHARMAEQGGWMPGELTASVGEPLKLRLVSDDVTHSFAVGKMDMTPVDLFPGEVQEISLTFDKPGKYTYYCSRWCGPNHWRMRGTIDVIWDGAVEPQPDSVQPLYVELGIDIDTPHLAQVTPQFKPETEITTNPFSVLDEKYHTISYYYSHSPAEAWQELRLDLRTHDLSDEEIWSLVAAIWLSNTTPEQLDLGQELYTENCAACHGQTGGGDGVFARQTDTTVDSMQSEPDGHDLKPPTDFTAPVNMLGASPALLHGKIVRGGMGTGMPYWGPIFTEEQVWALVSYLWTFQFEYTLEVK